MEDKDNKIIKADSSASGRKADSNAVYTPITFDKFIRWTLVVLGVVVVFLIVNYLSAVLLPFFVAWLFAYLLYPIVKFVEYKLHVPTRPLSIIVTLIFVLAIIGGIVYLIIPPMIDQLRPVHYRSDPLSP